jgi:hypothetical protein
MKQLLANFHSLKMGVVYTAQERMKTYDFDDDDTDSDVESSDYLMVPDLPDSVRGAVNSLVDVIGRLYTVRLTPEDPEKPPRTVRRLYVGVHDRYDTGFRSEYTLPEVIRNPTIPQIVKMMSEGEQS